MEEDSLQAVALVVVVSRLKKALMADSVGAAWQAHHLVVLPPMAVLLVLLVEVQEKR